MANRVFLLDRSGSMETCRSDTIGGYNAFVDSQKALGGTMTLYLFDHELATVYENVPIDQVNPLTTDTFVPRGGTALLDAMGEVLKKPLAHDTTMIILTDGEENSSRTYTSAHVKDLVAGRTKDGWQFTYLGANQDVVLAAQRLGLGPAQTIEFDQTRTPQLFATLSQRMSSTPNNLPGSV